MTPKPYFGKSLPKKSSIRPSGQNGPPRGNEIHQDIMRGLDRQSAARNRGITVSHNVKPNDLHDELVSAPEANRAASRISSKILAKPGINPGTHSRASVAAYNSAVKFHRAVTAGKARDQYKRDNEGRFA